MILSCFLALLLLHPRCKYLTAATDSQAGWLHGPHADFSWRLSHQLFRGCSPPLPTHRAVSCCCFLACLFRARIREFQWFLVKRALPLQQAVISLCLIHKEGSQQEHNCFHWLLTAFEWNKMTKREETLISSSLSSPCLRVTLGGQFSWRKERTFLFLATGVWQKRLLKSAVSIDWYVFHT